MRLFFIEFAQHGSLEGYINAATRIATIIQETNHGSGNLIRMPFTKIQALEWSLQISSGMAFLHSRGLIHRDLKPGNFLLNDANKVLIADLGTVRRASSDTLLRSQSKEDRDANEAQLQSTLEAMCEENKLDDAENNDVEMNTFMTRLTGTPMFMAPEQFGQEYSYPVDVWGFGITLIQLFTLKYPYEGHGGLALVVGIMKRELRPRDVSLNDVPDPSVLSLINQCLMEDPNQRPTFKMIERKLKQSLSMYQKEKKLVRPLVPSAHAHAPVGQETKKNSRLSNANVQLINSSSHRSHRGSNVSQFSSVESTFSTESTEEKYF